LTYMHITHSKGYKTTHATKVVLTSKHPAPHVTQPALTPAAPQQSIDTPSTLVGTEAGYWCGLACLDEVTDAWRSLRVDLQIVTLPNPGSPGTWLIN